MRKAVFCAIAASMILACGLFAFSFDAAADGKAVFDKKCKMCHTDTKNPLAGVGSKYKADELKKWILTPREMKADGKMPVTKGLADKDVSDLVAYLSTLKK
jgi:cytochrome c2